MIDELVLTALARQYGEQLIFDLRFEKDRRPKTGVEKGCITLVRRPRAAEALAEAQAQRRRKVAQQPAGTHGFWIIFIEASA